MGRASLGLAKNIVRRALRAILDREPSVSEKTRVWTHFKSACAYCGKKLLRAARNAHLDHLVHRGPNHISNRVLSCGICNGNEKRDRDWLEFLKGKAPTSAILRRRRSTIESWVASCEATFLPHDKAAYVEREILRVIGAIDGAAERLRSNRSKRR